MSARRLSYPDDEDDWAPIPLNLPSAPFHCRLVVGRNTAGCLGQECPITMTPLTADNTAAFECRGGSARMPSIVCFNMFALVLSFIAAQQGVPSLPTNRVSVTDRDQQILMARVLSKMIDNYAADADHEDHYFVQGIRAALAGRDPVAILGAIGLLE